MSVTDLLGKGRKRKFCWKLLQMPGKTNVCVHLHLLRLWWVKWAPRISPPPTRQLCCCMLKLNRNLWGCCHNNLTALRQPDVASVSAKRLSSFHQPVQPSLQQHHSPHASHKHEEEGWVHSEVPIKVKPSPGKEKRWSPLLMRQMLLLNAARLPAALISEARLGGATAWEMTRLQYDPSSVSSVTIRGQLRQTIRVTPRWKQQSGQISADGEQENRFLCQYVQRDWLQLSAGSGGNTENLTSFSRDASIRL